MQTITKLFAPTWILVIFFLMATVFSNSFQEVPGIMDQPSTESEQPAQASVEPSETVLLYFEDEVEPSESPRHLYGTCGPDDLSEEYYGYDIRDNWLTLVAEPLFGKDLYIFYIAQIVEQYYPDVDPYITLAVLESESNYNPDVVSRVGAVGLMQVLSKYHARRVEQYGLNDLFDPYTNIICGMDLLNELYLKYGDWSKALYGYNHSTSYVNNILYKAEILRKDGYFG